ncbi:MAG: serine/threonine-protein kinase [Acidimicrobiales bacterium]
MDGIADYQFIERLGEGNHGTFWLARPPVRLGQLDLEYVAVKTLAQQATDQDFKRMANELRVYAAVESDYLVPVYDAGHQDGRLYYATSYFADGSLGSPSRPMERSEVIGAVADAALGAHALHEAGIAHRDIKPDNLMIDRTGNGSNGATSDSGSAVAGMRTQLGDLGLAQIINPGQTVTGIGPVGTIEYLAPELVQGQVASRASDIWALGVTLHRTLTGRSVYRSLPVDSLLEALRYVLTVRPTLDPELDPAIEPIIGRCLAEDPAARYQTAAELAEVLRPGGRP